LKGYEYNTNVAQQAQIAQNIESWPNKYHTILGERSIQLSTYP